MIPLIEFLDSNSDFFEEDSRYLTCTDTGHPYCTTTEMKHGESGKLEFNYKNSTNNMITLDLKSWTIEYNSKKYTIDESNSGYEKGGTFDSYSYTTHDALKIHTVPTRTGNELRTVIMRKL